MPTLSPKITITLSAANLGPSATEEDFDAWAAYVAAHVDEACSVDAEVDQAAFTGRYASAEDSVTGADSDVCEAVRRWLSVDGWEAFCSAQSESERAASVQFGTPDGFAY